MFERHLRTSAPPTRRAWNDLVEHLETLPITPGPGMLMRRTPRGTVLWPVKRRGGGIGDGGRWTINAGKPAKIFVGEGFVNYFRLTSWDTEDDITEQPEPQFVRGKVPTLDGTPLTAEDRPFFDASGKTGGTVWLVVQAHECIPSALPPDPERLLLTNKSVRPEIDNGEVAIEIASFDLEDVPGSETGAKRLKNLAYKLRSDWEQPYLCAGNVSPDDDSFLGDGSADSEPPDSTPEDSTDDPPPRPAGCKVSMSVRWLNKVDCFPPGAAYTGALPCTPGPFTFELEVTFTGIDPFDKPCPGWAYGVRMEGSSTPEVVWVNSRTKVVKFHFDSAPACGRATVVWRARGFGPFRGPDNEIIPSCCGHLFSGSITTEQLPPVCGCGCSSSGDLDGDGVPNDIDDDIDGDGWGNDVDGDVDGDGILDEADPDIDGDGTPNEGDSTPEGQ